MHLNQLSVVTMLLSERRGHFQCSLFLSTVNCSTDENEDRQKMRNRWEKLKKILGIKFQTLWSIHYVYLRIDPEVSPETLEFKVTYSSMLNPVVLLALGTWWFIKITSLPRLNFRYFFCAL